MISFQRKKSGSIRRYLIVGGRRLSNYWWSLVLFLGGCGFLLTGISSYFNRNFWVLPFELEHFGKSLDIFVELIGSLINKSSGIFTTATPLTSFFSPNIKPLNFNPSAYVENNLPFFPQGLVLSFYGFLGLSFSFHLWFTLFWKIGGGFNEFNGKERSVRIFRWGRPGKNRRIDLKYTNELIEAIKVELIPRPALFLRIKGEKNIPLTRTGEFLPLEELEAQAAELTSFLRIPLEMES